MRVAIILALVGSAAMLADQTPQGPDRDPTRYEEAIQAFETEDRASPPPRDETLFLGSSSITNWDLGKAFPDLTAIKRGYGGSHVSDSIHFADRIIFPYTPKVIVFYGGDADVNAGKRPQRIRDDYEKLVATVRARLPETRMVIIGVKSSLAHWDHIDQIREANALVEAFTHTDPLLAFADVDPALIGDDGKPRPELFAENGLNLSEAGYDVWTSVVRPLVIGR